MKNYLYVLYNKLSGRYEGVMSFASDEMAIHRLSGQQGPDKEEFELCRVGSMEIETGIIVSEAPVRLIWQNNTELPKSEAQ